MIPLSRFARLAARGRAPILMVALLAIAVATGGERPAPAPAPATTGTEELRIQVGRETISKLIRAAVPYEVRLDTGLFEQVVTLAEPRDIRLVRGGIRLRMTATGKPVPFVAEVTPEVRVLEDASGTYTIQVKSMPVSMGRAGTYDLASFIKPIPIEKVSRHLISGPTREIGLDLIVRRIEVNEEELVVTFGTAFD